MEICAARYCGEPTRSMLEFEPTAIVVTSFSKYFSMAGWRLGWLITPRPEAARAMTTQAVQQPDGSWVPTTVNVYDVVFEGADYSGSGTFSAFTQAAEDARAIVNFIHEYAIPADEVE